MATAPTAGYYGSLAILLASAVAAVAAVFLMFDSVLSELIPPIEGSRLGVQLASFLTVIVLLMVSLLIRKRLRQSTTIKLVAIGVALVVVTLGVFWYFQSEVGRYVYQYPYKETKGVEPAKYVAGDWRANIAPKVQGRSVAQMVSVHGEPQDMDGVLWDAESRELHTSRIRMLYILLAMVMTTTLFMVGVALWRVTQHEGTARPTA